jgi:hypothetical protein
MNIININLFIYFFNLKKKRRNQVIDEIEHEVIEVPYLNALSLFASNLTSLIILYPMETILNRLIVQGTRTIIDNTDYGYGVIPINTRYEGFFDCLRTIEHTEGLFGLYKGLGCAILEALLAFGLLKLGKLAAYCIYDAIWISRNDKSNLEFLTQQTTIYRQPPLQQQQQQQHQYLNQEQ